MDMLHFMLMDFAWEVRVSFVCENRVTFPLFTSKHCTAQHTHDDVPYESIGGTLSDWKENKMGDDEAC